MTVILPARTRERVRVRAGDSVRELDAPEARLGRLRFVCDHEGWHVHDDGLNGGMFHEGHPVRHLLLRGTGRCTLRVGSPDGHRVEVELLRETEGSEPSRQRACELPASGEEVEQAPLRGSSLPRSGGRVETRQPQREQPSRPPPNPRPKPALVARRLGVHGDSGDLLLHGIDLALEPGTLTAVVGPSGAGKSTLLHTLAGQRQPSVGGVWWQGRNLHEEYAELRTRIGLVPQEEIQHPQLGVRQSLAYSARLRLPADTGRDELESRVAEVIDQVGLRHQARHRIGSQLSGGQRKRVSIATELLTAPPLLFLDEPTSGLDPGRDRSVMHHLRELADDGRVVAVATHSVLGLDLCDTVVVLARGGRLAFTGSPDGLLEHFGCAGYPELFDLLESADFRPPTPGASPPVVRRPVAPAASSSPGRQLSTLVRRNLALLLADRLHLAMLVLMPLMLAGLSRVVPGDHGLSLALTRAGRGMPVSPDEAHQRLTILVIAAALMGTAMAVRELVAERSVFRREYAVGLSPGVYHASKALVFGVACLAQGVLLTRLALWGLPEQDRGGVHGWGWWEVALPIGLLAAVMALLGLWVSALVRSTEQTMPALVAVVMSQVALCGALIEVAGRPVLEQLALLAPGRWAYAAASASANLERGTRGGDPDPLAGFSAQQWLLDLGGLAVLGLVAWWAGARVVRRMR